MAIKNTGSLKRKPTHPGEMLREDFLPDYGLTVSSLADSLGVSRQSINELLREKRLPVFFSRVSLTSNGASCRKRNSLRADRAESAVITPLARLPPASIAT